MDRGYLRVHGVDYPLLRDGVQIGSWEEVKDLPVATLTKRDGDTGTLSGLVIKGYEMKFGATNENGERYEKTAFDAFIKDYFVGKGLNMVVDIEHAGEYSPEWNAGRVIYAETNTTGFYFVAYIPATYPRYDLVKFQLQEGILQGFSKCGYATNYEWRYTKGGDIDYLLVKEFEILRVSLVCSPANGVPFERVSEIKNALVYKSVTGEDDDRKKRFIDNELLNL